MESNTIKISFPESFMIDRKGAQCQSCNFLSCAPAGSAENRLCTAGEAAMLIMAGHVVYYTRRDPSFYDFYIFF